MLKGEKKVNISEDISEENVIKELQRKNPSALEYIIKKIKSIYTLVSDVLKDICNQEDIKECTRDVFYAVFCKYFFHKAASYFSIVLHLHFPQSCKL